MADCLQEATPTAIQNAAVAAQDGEFISAVGAGRLPRSSVESALPAMRVLARLQDMDRSAGG